MTDTAALLERVVIASGVSPVEWLDGWETRGWTTSNGAPFNPQIVVWHHTWLPVPFPVSVLRDGRPDVSGPLCHLNIKPDRLVVIAGEGANHGGVANESVYRDALKGIAHDLTAAQRGLEDSNEAWHEWAFGVEVDWAGDPGDPITAFQDSCIKKLMLAWHVVQGLVPGNHITHAETTKRKWDPGFTRSVWKPYRTWLADKLEDDMALTPEQQAFLAAFADNQILLGDSGTSLGHTLSWLRAVAEQSGIDATNEAALATAVLKTGGGSSHNHKGQSWFEGHQHDEGVSGPVKS